MPSSLQTTWGASRPHPRIRTSIHGYEDKNLRKNRCQQTARVSAQPLLTPGLVDAVGHYGGDVADTEQHW